MGKGVGLPAGGGKNPLLSAGEDEAPFLGHPNPILKALCPGLPMLG
jgi:hypothetical protein